MTARRNTDHRREIPALKGPRHTIVLAIGDGRRELSLLRVGRRRYELCLRVRGKVKFTHDWVGMPSTRLKALDVALQRAAELRLLSDVVVQRARAARALAQTAPPP